MRRQTASSLVESQRNSVTFTASTDCTAAVYLQRKDQPKTSAPAAIQLNTGWDTLCPICRRVFYYLYNGCRVAPHRVINHRLGGSPNLWRNPWRSIYENDTFRSLQGAEMPELNPFKWNMATFITSAIPPIQLWWSSCNVAGQRIHVKYHVDVSFLFSFLHHAHRSHF